MYPSGPGRHNSQHQEGNERDKGGQDLLAQEKTELEKVVADLLNASRGRKEKLEQINAILEA